MALAMLGLATKLDPASVACCARALLRQHILADPIWYDVPGQEMSYAYSLAETAARLARLV
jgi:hypothetical protein